MISVLVAEDKHPILRNVVGKIERFGPEIKVVGEATDGLKALELGLRLRPQILFTDIRMPGMDGLKLIAELVQALPDTAFVIISGYNDFEYAREAMRLGVTDFLLKPVTQPAIDDLLNKVTDRIRRDRERAGRQQWSDLLRGRPAPNREFGFPSADRAWSLMVACAGPLSRLVPGMPIANSAIRLDEPLKGFLAERYRSDDRQAWALDGEGIGETVIVFGSDAARLIDLGHAYEAFLARFGETAIRWAVAVHPCFGRPEDVRRAYIAARTALDKHAVFGRSSLVFADESPSSDPSRAPADPAYDKHKLASYIKSNKKEALAREIEDCLLRWEARGYTQSMVEAGLYQLAYDVAQASPLDRAADGDLKWELDEIIASSIDYPSLKIGVLSLLDTFFQPSAESALAPASARQLIDRVEAFFQKRLADEITVADAADSVNLNVSFLSREFKKAKGLSPIEYLTRLRIDKAKALIAEASNLRFREIAAMVGYSNPYYFSKVFKLVTGYTPSEYKSLQADADVWAPDGDAEPD